LRADVWPQNSPFSSVRRGGDLGAIRAGRLTVGRAGRGRGSWRLPDILPDMSNFAAEFFEYCAGRACAPRMFAKVWGFRAKLLAMQRASL
jgi:hypothetical protein